MLTLARPNLKLQFDIYHRQIIHGDVMRGLEAMMPIIGHVQIAAVPARNEPGTGELDDKYVFRLLDRLGYRGFVGCEYRPAGKTLDGLGWRRGLAPPVEAAMLLGCIADDLTGATDVALMLSRRA